MTPLQKLREFGQSCWLDNLTRRMVRGGELRCRVERDGLLGVTSNPNTFDQAITDSEDYSAQIDEAVATGCSSRELYEALVTTDVREACDVLRPVYEDTAGGDGYVSLEVSPRLARATEASVREARRLWETVDRPNLFIKVPGTAEGVPAIETLLFEGINVNITLLFSVASYEAVAETYLRALERRVQAGRSVSGIASVASFFLSRIDVLVDQLLEHRMYSGHEVDPDALRGHAAIANAKLAYLSFERILASERWQALEQHGARAQRLLWASTGTKNPRYRDVMYVEPLIGPHTVSTMPSATLDAFRDHGRVRETVREGVTNAEQVMLDLYALGIEFDHVTRQLENEGVQKFIEPFDALLAHLATLRERRLVKRELPALRNMARRLRRRVVEMTTAAGSGHLTSCLSCADLIAALFFREMRWDPTAPEARNVDSFILSKGHAAPILWAALVEAGASDEDPLTLRRIDSSFEGHPMPSNAWVQVATGSLGQGLAAANGMALANRLDGIDARVFCLLGDGECSEGSVWEAAQFASLNKLSNLVAIVDVNGLGQSETAPYHHETSVFARRFEAFGWRAIELDGHDLEAVLDALYDARTGGPTALIARTEKGKGIPFLEGADGWHGTPLEREDMERALAEIGEAEPAMRFAGQRVGSFSEPPAENAPPLPAPNYEMDAAHATRDGYGKALVKLGQADPRIVALDGDVKNSTRTEGFAQALPERFFQSYIAEQNMAGTALGLAVCGKIPFAASFACFLTRAADFVRMAGHSRPRHLVFCGSHAGVSIGEDGPSQMGLEDIALFRAVLGSTVLYPCDAVSAERLTEQAARTEGIVYLRTSRGKTPVIYDNDEAFPVGGSKTLRASAKDAVTVVAAGVTVHEALAAYAELARQGITVRVIDLYSVKPLDSEALARAAEETKALLVVEDHWPEGGIGEAVSAAVGHLAPVHRLAVTGEPRSGKPEQLLERHGISRSAIVRQVLELAG